MKPENINQVESKIQYHFKERPIDDTPESLKPKNLRYLDQSEQKIEMKPKTNKDINALLSPVRASKN